MSKFTVTSPDGVVLARSASPTGREILMDAYQESLDLSEEIRRVLIAGGRVPPREALNTCELLRITRSAVRSYIKS